MPRDSAYKYRKTVYTDTERLVSISDQETDRLNERLFNVAPRDSAHTHTYRTKDCSKKSERLLTCIHHDDERLLARIHLGDERLITKQSHEGDKTHIARMHTSRHTPNERLFASMHIPTYASNERLFEGRRETVREHTTCNIIIAAIITWHPCIDERLIEHAAFIIIIDSTSRGCITCHHSPMHT